MRGSSTQTMIGMRPTEGGMNWFMLCWSHATKIQRRGRNSDRMRNQSGIEWMGNERESFMR